MRYEDRIAMNADMVAKDVVELCVILTDDRICKKLQTMTNLGLQLGNPELYEFDYEPGARHNYVYAYYKDRDVARRIFNLINEGNSFLERGFLQISAQEGFNIIRDKKDGKLYVDGFAHRRLYL